MNRPQAGAGASALGASGSWKGSPRLEVQGGTRSSACATQDTPHVGWMKPLRSPG